MFAYNVSTHIIFYAICRGEAVNSDSVKLTCRGAHRAMTIILCVEAIKRDERNTMCSDIKELLWIQ